MMTLVLKITILLDKQRVGGIVFHKHNFQLMYDSDQCLCYLDTTMLSGFLMMGPMITSYTHQKLFLFIVNFLTDHFIDAYL